MNRFSRPFARIAAFALPAALALSGCTQTFDAKVKRFSSALPAPAGQTFAVVPEDPRDQGGLEFAQYASGVTAHLAQLGYQPVQNPANADLVVRFGYGVDKGRDRVRSIGVGADPFWSPWYGGGFGGYGGFYGGGFGRRGFYGNGFGGGFGRPWGYGWYDPFFYDNNIDVVRIYQSEVDMTITRRDGERLFEGKAEAASTSSNLSYLVPNLIEAMFTGFPGNSGQTVRISVAPEKRQPVRR